MQVKRHVNIRAANVDAAVTAALQIRRGAVAVVVGLVREGEVTSPQAQKVALPQAQRRHVGDQYLLTTKWRSPSTRQQLYTLLLLP